MTAEPSETSEDGLDVSDLDRHMGVPMMPGELREPFATNDIRRWVQAMHYPNPLHYDATYAAESRFGRLIAPQSFTVAADTSHGCAPAQVGRIPDSHLVFGGDEWWFFEGRIEAGDHVLCHRMPYDYKVTETSFAGPTCFQRGDTVYLNQKGERIALQRSTAIRYKVRKAKEKKLYDPADAEPEWTDQQLEDLDAIKKQFIDQIQTLGHDKRLLGSVQQGDVLAPQAMGPHSLASFATEWRAYPMTTWGGMAKGPTSVRGEDLGYTKDFAGHEGDRNLERTDPERTDGAYYGPSRGHLQPQWATKVGMPRGYGYGASMGAWMLDYVAAWAGEWGWLRHADLKYRSPALTGDATIITGTVLGTREERRRVHVADVEVVVKNQADKVQAKGTVSVQLPLESSGRMPIHYELGAREGHEHVVLITIDRPEAKNACDLEHFHALTQAWRDFNADPNAWVAIVTGVGRNFMSGADLKTYIPEVTKLAKQIQAGETDKIGKYSLTDGTEAVLRGSKIYKPIIAAINGPCVAGGMEMLGGADIRIATDHATFGVLEPARGLFAGGGTTVRLPRQIPFALAQEFLLCADRVDAQRAFEMGLLNQIVAEDDLLDAAFAFAARITKNAPLAVQATKRSVVEGLKGDMRAAYKLESQISQEIFSTEDAKEGPKAFAEKRAPVWQGK